MTSVEFNNLSLSQKSYFLWKQGVHLSSRDFTLYTVHLYSFESFFVEVHYTPSPCFMEKICLLNTDEVIKYLDHPLPADLLP
ncbi:MAG: hypothetical protein ACLFUB_12615 [Cyclobacteriaceae bacterium]